MPADAHAFHGLGAAFFPEHHPRSTWREYVSLLAEANLSFVRMAEFTWDKMEPSDGHFDFDWLDEVLGLLDAKGIRVVLCTPTAVPPRWACDRYPDIRPVMEDGRVWGFGVRRYTCPTSPSYRRLSARLAAELARRYGQSPQILAWQLDNELGHPFCFCPRCREHFQTWCRERFGTIERFNDELVTHFWGQSLVDFSQIDLPNTSPSPSRWLIYHRFYSDMTLACYQGQIDALRGGGVRAPITTNMMVTWYGYDHEAMGRNLDVIAGDHYGLGPKPLFGQRFTSEAFVSAYLRGIRHGQPNWFLEFQCCHAGLPGLYRWEALTQVGLGADLINYFRFDTCASGNERGGGMVGVHRRPGWDYHEIRQVAGDLRKARPTLEGSAPLPARVALLYTFANHCEYARYPKSAEFEGMYGNGYSMHLARHYHALAAQNIACDIVYPEGDFGAYNVIVAPALYVLPRALAAKLERFVRAGGTLVLTSFSGLADEYAKLWDIPIPGPLGPVFGIEVLNAGASRPEGGPVRLVAAGGRLDFAPIEAVSWMDAVLPQADDVEVLARFEHPFQAAVAATRRPCGRGWAHYLGAILSDDGYARFYRALAKALDLRPTLDLPEGLYASVRVKGDQHIVFLNNPDPEARALDLPGRHVDLFSGEPVTGALTLKPFDVRVFTAGPGR
jgi:beta-galactosidase